MKARTIKVYTYDAIMQLFEKTWDNGGKVYHTTTKHGADMYIVRHKAGYPSGIIFTYYGWNDDYMNLVYTARRYRELPMKYRFSGETWGIKPNGSARSVIYA